MFDVFSVVGLIAFMDVPTGFPVAPEARASDAHPTFWTETGASVASSIERSTAPNEPVKVLVVGEDEATRELFSGARLDHVFRVHFASCLRDGRRALASLRPHMVILDLRQRDGDALDLLPECHVVGAAAIVIAGLASQIDKLLALEKGALDFLTKPVDGRELILKVKRFAALARQSRNLRTVEWESNGVRFSFLDLGMYSRTGKRVGLTGSEARILRVLFEQEGKWIGRDQLLKVASNRSTSTDTRTVDILISRLRKKLMESGYPGTIRSIRNVGYQLSAS
jgi:DNA-binding response OmpR family regulator